MPHIDSSIIARIAYDALTRELEIVFHTGRVYTYSGVPAEVYYQFTRATSAGAFFNTMIRDRYRFVEVR